MCFDAFHLVLNCIGISMFDEFCASLNWVF